jgi:ABC-type dipeptide/oligopeptide/nickel transport system permease component
MLNHDYPVVQSVILLIASIMVLMNIIVDLSYAVINPQVGYDGE